MGHKLHFFYENKCCIRRGEKIYIKTVSQYIVLIGLELVQQTNVASN